MKKILNFLFLAALTATVNAQLSVPGGTAAIQNSGANGMIYWADWNHQYPAFKLGLGDGEPKNTFLNFTNSDHEMSINGDGSIGFGIYKSDYYGHYTWGVAKYGLLLKFFDDAHNGTDASFKFQFAETKNANGLITSWVSPLEINRSGVNVNGDIKTKGGRFYSEEESNAGYFGSYGTTIWMGEIGNSWPNVLISYDGIGVFSTRVVSKEVWVRPSVWPDYVFKSEYEQLSLTELESYIKTYQHLPDIPTEAEILKNGLNLGEMDALLLRKVEELTKYVIGLKKENEILKERIDNITK